MTQKTGIIAAENSAFPPQELITKYIKIENTYFKLGIISQYYCFYCIIYQTNAALVSKAVQL